MNETLCLVASGMAGPRGASIEEYDPRAADIDAARRRVRNLESAHAVWRWAIPGKETRDFFSMRLRVGI